MIIQQYRSAAPASSSDFAVIRIPMKVSIVEVEIDLLIPFTIAGILQHWVKCDHAVMCIGQASALHIWLSRKVLTTFFPFEKVSFDLNRSIH